MSLRTFARIYSNKVRVNRVQYSVQYHQFCFNYSRCTVLQVLKRIAAYKKISSEEQ